MAASNVVRLDDRRRSLTLAERISRLERSPDPTVKRHLDAIGRQLTKAEAKLYPCQRAA